MRRNISLFLIIFSFFVVSVACAGDLRIHFLDVGEGEAILIETPSAQSVLIDSGNLITGSKVLEYLTANNIDTVDYLIFTHPHPDHIGGAFSIMQSVKVRRVYDNGQDLTQVMSSQDIYRWYVELVRNFPGYKALQKRDRINVGKVSLHILWPPYPTRYSDFNTNSLVIMVEYGKFRALLTGDANSVSEEELIRARKDLRAQVLKVGHHGAKDATSEEFLKRVSPQVAIISVNKDNIRGYPDNQTVARLYQQDIVVYRTDCEGNIVLTADSAGNISVETKE